jgi:hypothetical protein
LTWIKKEDLWEQELERQAEQAAEQRQEQDSGRGERPSALALEPLLEA